MRSEVAVGALLLAITVGAGCASRSGWDEFAGLAEAICSEGTDAIDSLGPMPTAGTRDESVYAIALAAIQTRIATGLGDLDVSADSRLAFDQWVARLESLARKARAYGAQIRASGVSLDGELGEVAVDAQDAAFDLGLTECAHFGVP
ncbi:MAG: hypothetical protein M3277_11495 [Actinomycetota bacterium]|nr:hypothetical protein [Actinomycetota bacterium]